MSLYDYNQSREIANNYSFTTLVMALARRADDGNTEKIKLCWPEIYEELYQRYHAPGGLLPHEVPVQNNDVWKQLKNICRKCQGTGMGESSNLDSADSLCNVCGGSGVV